MMSQPPISIDGWLAFNENGTAKWSKREPSLGRSERAMRLTLKVPRELFRTPSLRATITIPEGTMAPAFEIDAVTVAEALKQVTGLDVDLKIVLPETEDAPQ